MQTDGTRVDCSLQRERLWMVALNAVSMKQHVNKDLPLNVPLTVRQALTPVTTARNLE